MGNLLFAPAPNSRREVIEDILGDIAIIDGDITIVSLPDPLESDDILATTEKEACSVCGTYLVRFGSYPCGCKWLCNTCLKKIYEDPNVMPAGCLRCGVKIKMII
jgi:hypothetical protein